MGPACLGEQVCFSDHPQQVTQVVGGSCCCIPAECSDLLAILICRQVGFVSESRLPAGWREAWENLITSFLESGEEWPVGPRGSRQQR